MNGKPPARCVACGAKEFTAPKDIHGYVPATFGWFGDPLVGFACAKCGYVHLYLKPRKKVSDRLVGDTEDRGDGAGEGDGGAKEGSA
jgi:Zn ribbon nucleic-acid-binding protein